MATMQCPALWWVVGTLVRWEDTDSSKGCAGILYQGGDNNRNRKISGGEDRCQKNSNKLWNNSNVKDIRKG